jgi:hypothetical protein
VVAPDAIRRRIEIGLHDCPDRISTALPDRRKAA